jgi:hypothetical protein
MIIIPSFLREVYAHLPASYQAYHCQLFEQIDSVGRTKAGMVSEPCRSSRAPDILRPWSSAVQMSAVSYGKCGYKMTKTY